MVAVPAKEGRRVRLRLRPYLRFMERQASCRTPSISARLAVEVPFGLERKVTGGAWESSFSEGYTAPWS